MERSKLIWELGLIDRSKLIWGRGLMDTSKLICGRGLMGRSELICGRGLVEISKLILGRRFTAVKALKPASFLTIKGASLCVEKILGFWFIDSDGLRFMWVWGSMPRPMSIRLIWVFQKFLMSLSVLPGNWEAIRAYLHN